MSTSSPLVPLLIDDETLLALAGGGYRWKEGQGGRARYRWLLPPDWVLAGDLPARQGNGLEPLCGAGDRSGRLTAVLALLRSCDDPPEQLAARGASPGARLGGYRSRRGPVAERLEVRDGQTIVTAVHAFTAGGEPHRFFVAALGPGDDPGIQRQLRLIGAALALHDEVAGALDEARLGGQLRG